MLKLVIVSPKYQMNVGYIARIAKNFGIEKLHIVKPRANIVGKKAIMFSKHAHNLLENAAIYNDLASAINGCDVVIGTTGLIKKANPRLRKVYYVDELAERFKNSKICLVIGRDDIGLKSEELEMCDAIAYIPTNKEYPVLNISAAVAILLYSFRSHIFKEKISHDKEYYREKEALFEIIRKRIYNKKGIREKEEVIKIFKKVINRAEPTMHELRSLIIALK
ncbi:MAG: TrmJ/YjtD family RNA methyltransferase [Candidatus Micrarchaeota archaeon]